MPPLIDLFRVLRAGEELANAETWTPTAWLPSLALSLLLSGCSMLGPQSPRPIVSDCRLGLAIHRPQGLTEEDTEDLRGTLMDPVFTLIPTVMCRF